MRTFVYGITLAVVLCLAGRVSAQDKTCPPSMVVQTNSSIAAAKVIAGDNLGCSTLSGNSCASCNGGLKRCKSATEYCPAKACADCHECCLQKLLHWCCYRPLPSCCHCISCNESYPHVWAFFTCDRGCNGCGYSTSGCWTGACASGGCATGGCSGGGCGSSGCCTGIGLVSGCSITK
jgi:hypothetical protein